MKPTIWFVRKWRKPKSTKLVVERRTQTGNGRMGLVRPSANKIILHWRSLRTEHKCLFYFMCVYFMNKARRRMKEIGWVEMIAGPTGHNIVLHTISNKHRRPWCSNNQQCGLLLQPLLLPLLIHILRIIICLFSSISNNSSRIHLSISVRAMAIGHAVSHLIIFMKFIIWKTPCGCVDPYMMWIHTNDYSMCVWCCIVSATFTVNKFPLLDICLVVGRFIQLTTHSICCDAEIFFRPTTTKKSNHIVLYTNHVLTHNERQTSRPWSSALHLSTVTNKNARWNDCWMYDHCICITTGSVRVIFGAEYFIYIALSFVDLC